MWQGEIYSISVAILMDLKKYLRYIIRHSASAGCPVSTTHTVKLRLLLLLLLLNAYPTIC